MPTELSELLGNERWIEVQTDVANFNIAYRPSSATLIRQAKMQVRLAQMENLAENDPVAAATEMGDIVCDVVSNWDLEDDGEPVPLTPEVVAGLLPAWAFWAIINTIAAEGRAQEEEKKALSVTSDAILPRTGKRAKSQNGTRTSERRGTWA